MDDSRLTLNGTSKRLYVILLHETDSCMQWQFAIISNGVEGIKGTLIISSGKFNTYIYTIYAFSHYISEAKKRPNISA